ncbi:MAG: phosphocholine cytidylyltransferase family protein [Steroidobacteraceae bacterium]
MNVAKIPQKAIILSAGQGSRLLPHTLDLPKCLLDLAGRSMLGWQLEGLAAAGIKEAVVVTGFRSDLVAGALPGITPAGMQVRTFFNPFYKVADNLASCWMVRHELDGPALILNGDTLFEPAIARRLLTAPDAAITVTIDRKAVYDEDDMKVITVGERLTAIGKKLPMAEVTGESIGFLKFSAAGAAAFVAEIERTMRTLEGAGLWYLSAIHRLANNGVDVQVASIEGLQWGELDFPADLAECRSIAERFLTPQAGKA